MSIALYKYDNAVVPAERNVIYCQPLSTEEIYLKHLLPAVKHYLLPRIDKMLNDIDQLLMTDNDTVYLF